MEEDFKDTLSLNQIKTRFVPFQDLKTLFQQPKKFKCVNNNIAINVCSEKQCQISGFMCGQFECKCQDLHFKCKPVLLRRVVKSILKKSKQIPEQVKESYKVLYKEINKMIDDLSDLRIKFENEQEYFGLFKQDLQFVELIRDSKYDKICGKIINQMQNTMETQTQFSMYTKQKIIQRFKKQRQLFQQLYKSIENKYSKRDKNQILLSKLMYLDIESKKLSFQQQVPKQKIKNLKHFQFIPITINQNIGQFKKGFFKMSDSKNCNIYQKIQDNSWRQIVSTEQLPQQGKYFFEVNIHKGAYNNNFMIGALPEQLLQKQSSYSDDRSIYYYTHNGAKYPGGSSAIGRALNNNKGLVSVLIDMDSKQICWCIDRQYQGKYTLPQSLRNKKIYASLQTSNNGNTFQFMNSLQC